MKQRLIILMALIGLTALMVGLNAAAYVQQPKAPDTEVSPRRSTYNSGATGAKAFYTLLAETGRPVLRWQSPVSSLRPAYQNGPSVFVMIGPFVRELESHETQAILHWVSTGGRLVLIDRDPSKDLLITTSEYKLALEHEIGPEIFTTDPADQTAMTANTPAIRPGVPSLFTVSVNGVQPSRFAATVRYERNPLEDATPRGTGTAPADTDSYAPNYYQDPPETHDFFATPEPSPAPDPAADENSSFQYDAEDDEEADDSDKIYGTRASDYYDDENEDEDDEIPHTFSAPLPHLFGTESHLLVDVPYGYGRVTILADPFIVSNGGISMADNAQLAINLVNAGHQGTIAFDEYHHGFGSGNPVFTYFQGTPTIAIIAQISLIAAFVMLSRSRRFARPLPGEDKTRLTKLEYVGAMAQLQERTGAFDLAMENIYSDFRRRASRQLGVDNTLTPRKEFARLIAERTAHDDTEIEELMYKCEDIIHGEPVNKKTMLELIANLRELETEMRLTRQKASRI